MGCMTSRTLVRSVGTAAVFFAMGLASSIASVQSGASGASQGHPLVGEWRATRVEVGGREVDVPGNLMLMVFERVRGRDGR